MLGPEQLADVEGDALAIFRMAKVDPDQPRSMSDLCKGLTGRRPEYMRLLTHRGLCRKVNGVRRIFICKGLPPAVEKETLGHECAEWFYGETGYEEPDREEKCDALGAALCAPRPAFSSAMRVVGHRPSVLAEAFGVRPALTLLRIGEVSQRPVALLRPTDGPLVRGAPLNWPSGRELTKAIRNPPSWIHPVRLGKQWGLMARRAEWEDAA